MITNKQKLYTLKMKEKYFLTFHLISQNNNATF